MVGANIFSTMELDIFFTYLVYYTIFPSSKSHSIH